MIVLKVNKNKYSGWEDISITKDMTSIADTFKLSIEKGSALNVSEGDLIEIIDDDNTILKGYIEIYDISIEENKSPLILTGRSKAGDLVDCMIENYKQYNRLTPLNIISDIISDFDMSVSTNISLSTVDVFETKVGETFFNAINRLCKQTNILPISANNGDLLLTKNNKTTVSNTLKDKDLKAIKFKSDTTNQFSKYTYKKEAIVVDISDGSVSNSNMNRYRPFVGVNTDNKTNIDMANWKKNNADANSTQLEITVTGWDYEINNIVKIDSQIIKNSYLIKSINYTKGNNGKISNITLVDKGLFDV